MFCEFTLIIKQTYPNKTRELVLPDHSTVFSNVFSKVATTFSTFSKVGEAQIDTELPQVTRH